MEQMNVFQYANLCERMFEDNLGSLTGYERKTTFYSDLSIAEWFGIDSVRETYDRVMKEWIGDVEYITEFVLCLNWKCWEHYNNNNQNLSELYKYLYRKADEHFLEHYKNDRKAIDYYYEVTD